MNTSSCSTLSVENLCYSIGSEIIIDNINFSLTAGEVSCLVGPSGCGKTTLLKLIAGLLSPDSGSILFNQQNIAKYDGNRRLDLHPAMIVFQDLGLFPHMNVAQNVGYGLDTKISNRRDKVNKILSQLGLNGYSTRYPHELSGGQQQRIALARALILKPKILLLDEPFANLDTALRQPLSEEILSLLKERGIITLLVTHDREDALSLGDYIGVMDNQHILQWGTPQNLLDHPVNTQVAKFTGHNASIKGTLAPNNQVETIFGQISIRNRINSPVEKGPVEVLLRCCDAKVTADSSYIAAKVIYRSFEAEKLIYALKLVNDEQIFALADDQPDLHVGHSTYVKLINQQVSVFN